MVIYLLHILVFAAIFIILTLSLNLIIGFSGQVSLGHAAFYCIGAYVSSVILVDFDLPYIFALLSAFLAAGIMGVILGIPTLRLKDDYLAIVTLAFGLIVIIILLNIDEIVFNIDKIGLHKEITIGGPDGKTGIPGPVILGKTLRSKIDFILLTWSFVAITIIFMYRLQRSRVGTALAAIRDDDVTAQVMGINTTKYKVMAFGLGSGFAGIAGSLYSSYIHYIKPTDFGLSASILILCMVVVGGIGSISGSIVGAVILTALPEILRILTTSPEVLVFLDRIPKLLELLKSFADYQNVAYGALLVLLLIVRPQGIMGKSEAGKKFSLQSRFKRKKSA